MYARRMVPMTHRVRRVGCKKSVPNRKNSPPLKKKLLAEQIQDELQESLTSYAIGLPTPHQLTCLEKQLEEAEAEAALYKLQCENREAEINERQHRVEELHDELKRTKIYAEMYKREAELTDASLQYCLETGSPIRHGADNATAEEIVCCSCTGYPTNVCTRCGDEEACVVVLPCSHLCLCLACESETNRCPKCGFVKSGWFWADVTQ